MSEAMRPAQAEPRLRHLVEVYCNAAVTDDEFEELEQRLAHDAEARSFYLRYLAVDSGLRDRADQVGAVWESDALQVSRPARPGWLLRNVSTVAAGLGLIAVTVVCLLWLGRDASEPALRVVCGLEQLNGSVAIAGSDGDVRPAASGAKLSLGNTVRTLDSQSSAALVYPDGTRLTLVGASSVTLSGDEPKSVTVHGGVVFASVQPQPAGYPMRIATHTDSLEILGTRFTLDVTRQETDVAVTEGRVRLTRSSDGNSVEVPAGQRVVSSAGSGLVLKEIAPPPEAWLEDFENGLPDDWGGGKLVAADLPTSQAAVQSVPVASKSGAPYEIATTDQWAHGLFTVHEDSHLEFTFKMREPGWLNILILTRTADDHSPAFAGNYLFGEGGWWPKQAETWATVSIPLAAFRPLPPARGGFEDAVPFQVLFSSPEGDRGLVIDRIAVKRGGPGAVVTKELP